MRMGCFISICVAFGFAAGLARAEKPVDAKASAAAVDALAVALKTEGAGFGKIGGQPFATIPLSKEDAARARTLLWDAHVTSLRKERAVELEKKELKDGNLVMPFFTKIFGEKPVGGRSLWISLHGGGGAPAKVNDGQYENQKKLYQPVEGIYLAPRAPTNTWNLWHEGHMDRFFARLVENFVALEGVNPDKVYIMGYSAGGDGVYQMAPRMADWWAGAAMMAGHPNGVSLLSLRNVPFALQVGANDNAYNRAKIGAEYGEQLVKLRKDDPKGYENFVRIREGKGHWMNLEDKEALPWLAKFSRNPVPDRVVWKQTGPTHDRSYWLAVPKGKAKGGSLVIAERGENRIKVTRAEDVDRLVIRLDDRMVPFSGPVAVEYNGKVVHSAPVVRTIGTLAKTLAERGDPQLMFDAELEVRLAAE